jgi:hypothetical protein
MLKYKRKLAIKADPTGVILLYKRIFWVEEVFKNNRKLAAQSADTASR